MNNGYVKKTVVICAAVLLVLLVLFLIFVLPDYGKTAEFKFEEGLEAFREALNAGDYERAYSRLQKCADSGHDSGSLRICLYHARRLSEISTDYGYLASMAEHATERFPGREDFYAVLVYARLRTGAYDDAVIDSALLVSPEFAGLSAELDLVRKDYQPRDADSAHTLLSTGVKLESVELVTDGLVMLCAAGRIGEAAVWLDTHDFWYAELDRFFTAAIQYDAERYERCIELLEEEKHSVYARLMQVDAYLRLGRTDTAKAAYIDLVREYPEIDSLPYLNLASIAAGANQPAQAGLWLEQGLTIFPEDRAMLVAYLWNRMEIDADTPGPEEIERLTAFLTEEERRFYALAFEDYRSNIERFRSSLWNMFNQNPSDIYLARYFVWFLLGLEDFDGFELVLERAVSPDSATGWHDFFRSIAVFRKGDFDKALFLMENAYEIEGRWEFLYDQALILLKKNDPETALERLLGIARLPEGRLDSQDRGRVYVTIAAVRERLGAYEQAYRDVAYALQLDPGNIDGLLIRNRLEGVMK